MIGIRDDLGARPTSFEIKGIQPCTADLRYWENIEMITDEVWSDVPLQSLNTLPETETSSSKRISDAQMLRFDWPKADQTDVISTIEVFPNSAMQLYPDLSVKVDLVRQHVFLLTLPGLTLSIGFLRAAIFASTWFSLMLVVSIYPDSGKISLGENFRRY